MHESVAMRKWVVIAMLLGAGRMPMRAQAAATDGAKGADAQSGVAFEVASMRLVAPGKQGFTSISPSGAGTFVAKNASGKLLLQMAFGIEGYQFAGVPGWADSTFYDVSARPVGDVGLTYEQMRPMLQNLLRERLKLVTHWSDTERSGYGLELRKGETGKRLQAGTGKASVWGSVRPDGLQGDDLSMKTVAAMLANVMGTPVVDDTGLSGTYNIRLKFAPLTAVDSDLPSLPAALEELGLTLKKRKVPVRMLMVDQMEKVPVAN
jgi:uncharacterized protein (TIGR03435 family)